MSTAEIVILSDLITLVLSLGTAAFIAGRSFGEIRQDIKAIQHDIAQIQGMFVIRIRRDSIDKEP